MQSLISVDCVILGAGVSGLACAHGLLDHGVHSIVVLDKEAVPGGLCRSVEVDGAPLDIGGGHFLDVKRKRVLDLVFRFLPEQEWASFNRISTIKLSDCEIDYPFESNLWQMPVERQVDYLVSIAEAGCNTGKPMPEKFSEWIHWKLGDKIARDYMIPYNRKVFSADLDSLGTYWLYKLPNVSLRDSLASCLEKRLVGELPAHARFLYPKRFGYGEAWRRMGDALGDRLQLRAPLTSLDLETLVVNGRYRAKRVISTVPWVDVAACCPVPAAVEKAIAQLQHASIDVTYQPIMPATAAHWTYLPDEELPHHRELYRANFLPGARGYWTETNSRRTTGEAPHRFRNPYAYPLNTLGKPYAIAAVLAWFEERRVHGLGRWGTWEHMNSDVAVEHALKFADELAPKLRSERGTT